MDLYGIQSFPDLVVRAVNYQLSCCSGPVGADVRWHCVFACMKVVVSKRKLACVLPLCFTSLCGKAGDDKLMHC